MHLGLPANLLTKVFCDFDCSFRQVKMARFEMIIAYWIFITLSKSEGKGFTKYYDISYLNKLHIMSKVNEKGNSERI